MEEEKKKEKEEEMEKKEKTNIVLITQAQDNISGGSLWPYCFMKAVFTQIAYIILYCLYTQCHCSSISHMYKLRLRTLYIDIHE